MFDVVVFAVVIALFLSRFAKLFLWKTFGIWNKNFYLCGVMLGAYWLYVTYVAYGQDVDLF